MFSRKSDNSQGRSSGSGTTQAAKSSSGAAKKREQRKPPFDPREMSRLSTPAVPDSIFHAKNFMLGAGIVIIQPSTGKVVLVNNGNDWFLPKGRKDQGESLEQAALREGFEESGYQAEFLPLFMDTSAPRAPTAPPEQFKITGEPLFTRISYYRSRTYQRYTVPAGEYITFWYVGHIGPDAVRQENTGMWDETGYVGHLLTVEDAKRKLGEDAYAIYIIQSAWNAWRHTVEYDKELAIKNQGFSLNRLKKFSIGSSSD